MFWFSRKLRVLNEHLIEISTSTRGYDEKFVKQQNQEGVFFTYDNLSFVYHLKLRTKT